VRGFSLAFLTASANFLAIRSSLFFCASTDCAKMESRRASASRAARAASVKSSNMRLRGAGVWLMMARVTGSTFSIAPHSGQVTSNASSLRPC